MQATLTRWFSFAVPIALLSLVACSKQARLEDHLKAGNEAFSKREFEKAKIEYLNVLQIQRTNALAYSRLGKILFEQGQPVSAYPLLVWARRAYPDDTDVREKLVVIYARAAGETNQVRFATEVEELLALSPTNEVALLIMAERSRTPEELNRLEQTLRELRGRAGDHSVFHIAEAELLRKRGDTNACEAALRKAIEMAPEYSVAHQAYGNYLTLIGRMSEAETHLRKAKDLTPPYAPAWERWAQFLLNARRVEEAKAVLDEINAKAPERIHAFATRAQIALSERDFDRAEKLLARALAQSPGDPEALRTMAQLRLAQNKPEEAVRELEKVIQTQPNSPQAHYQLALTHLVTKNTDQAIRSLEQAVLIDSNLFPAVLLLADLNIARGQPAAAINALRDVVRRQPRIEIAHTRLMTAERAAGRIADAEATGRAARRLFPQSPSIALQLGVLLREQNKIDEARTVFEEAARLGTNNLPAVEQLVALDVASGDYTNALRRITESIERAPTDPNAWLIKAEVHIASGDFDLAESALRKVLELDPNSEKAFLGLARLYVRTGRQEQALAELAEILQRDPKDLQALTLVGMLESNRGEFARSRDAYQKALEVRPESVLILNNLAFVLAEHLGRAEEALRHARKARELAPEDPLVADTLGWIEYRRGQYAEALRLISEAAAKLEGDGRLKTMPEVNYHLGMARYMMGDEEGARAALREAVATQGEYPGRDVARDHLAILELDTAKADARTIALLEKRLSEAPRDLVTLTRLGAAYEATGAFDKAREALEKALALNPQSITVLTRLADLYARRLNQPARALELARTARTVAPRNPEVAWQAGHLALQTGDFNWAYSLLEESYRAFGTNRADVAYDFGRAAYSQGRVNEAVSALNAVAGNAAADPALSESAGTFLEMIALAQRPASAVQARPRVEAILKADPNNGPALHAAAVIAQQEGRYADARRAYESLLNRFPGFTPAMRDLAILCAEHLQDDDTAYKVGLKARDADPRDDALAAAMGKVACRKGDYRYAVQLLTQAIRTRGTDASLYYHLGLAQRGLNQATEARAAFERALTLAPDAPFAPEIRKLIAEPVRASASRE